MGVSIRIVIEEHQRLDRISYGYDRYTKKIESTIHNYHSDQWYIQWIVIKHAS
jgi:hypothetical protein